MSSIQSLRNQYDQLRLQSISSQYNKANSTTKTAENSKAYFQSDNIEISEEGLAALEANRSKPPHINALEELVSNGTITEEQSKAIQEALEAQHEGEMRPMDKPHGKPPMGPPPAQGAESSSLSGTNLLDEDTLNSLLESLSSSNVITSDQKDAISSALNSLLEKLYGSNDEEETTTTYSL